MFQQYNDLKSRYGAKNVEIAIENSLFEIERKIIRNHEWIKMVKEIDFLYDQGWIFINYNWVVLKPVRDLRDFPTGRGAWVKLLDHCFSLMVKNPFKATKRLLEPVEELDDLNEMMEYKLRKIDALVNILECSLRGTSPNLRTVSFE